MSDREEATERQIGWVYIMMPMVPLVLLGLLNKNHFFRRHTQQGLLLGLVFWAGLFISGISEFGCLGMLASVLVVWIGGGIWGRRQVKRGDCWLMRMRGEEGLLPRSWAIPLEQRPEASGPVVSIAAPDDSDNPATAFIRGQTLLNQGQPEKAVKQFLFAFRKGQSDLRAKAANELEKLDEVEIF
ncbi:MAG: hypothetical protein WA996_21025 [Candidatus Promineifilaceae bacterium]